MYTASSLTSSVNSVRCTEIWLFSTLVLEKVARILLVISCIAVSLYFIMDINFAASTEKALPKHPMLFSFSGTNVYSLRSFAYDLSLPTKELLSKDIRGKSTQYIEIFSVPNCVSKMSDPTPPREESSHGKPSQYVGRSHTHFHFLCPTVLVILLIYQYINACYYNYSPYSSVMCLYMNRYVYMFCVLAPLNMFTTLSPENYVSNLYNYLSHSYTQPKINRVYDLFYLFLIRDSSRRHGE